MNESRPTRRGGDFSQGVAAGRVFGIPVVVTPSWFLIAALITWLFGPVVAARVPGIGETASYAVAAVFVLLLYGAVLVHELSHALVARALGLPVRRIVLQLLGGVSEIEREPQTAGREYLVAVAGPLTSILLAGVGAALLPLTGEGGVPAVLVSEFVWANGAVAVFNLLPGLPLDGGRVLRAALWHLRRDKLAGTLAAAYVGRGLAVVVAVLPLAAPSLTGGEVSVLSEAYFVILAVFIWSGAGAALAQTRVSVALPGLSVRALTRRALPVTSDVSVGEAVRRARAAGARALVVVDRDGRPAALVSEAAVSAVPEPRRPWVDVGTLARRLDDGLVLSAGLDGTGLLERLRHSPAAEYLVVEADGSVYGVLAQADVGAALSGTAGR